MPPVFPTQTPLISGLAPDDWLGLFFAILFPAMRPAAATETPAQQTDLDLPAPGARREPAWNCDPDDSAQDTDLLTSDPPIPAVPDLLPLQISAAVRLAQTLQPAGFQRAMTPGAVTVIDLGAAELIDPARQILTKRLLPFFDGGTAVKVVRAPQGDGPRGAERFALEVRDALLADRATRPLLILVASPSDLPRSLADLLPRPLQLAPVNRAGLIAHFCISHPANSAPRDTLPPDDALRRLTPLALVLALRAPKLADVLKAIAAAVAPPSGTAPTLEAVRDMGLAGDVAHQIVADLQRYRAGEIAWSEMTRSVVLYGPPGTGKTFLIRATAASASVPAIIASFASWQARGHLGDMLLGMKTTFSEARAAAPCILLIDEIDAAGSREDADRHGSNYRRQVINAFLAEVDGIAGLEGVVLAAACNNIGALDPAILRPGRFDRIVELGPPGPEALASILQSHLVGDLPHDLPALTRAAAGRTPAEIAGALRIARSAARTQRRPLAAQDVLTALEPKGEVPPLVRMRAAVHECGHAILAHLLCTGRVDRLTLSTKGGLTLIDTPLRAMTLPEIEADLAVLMAGRAAELLILGSASAGAGGPADSDLARATALAAAVDTRFGLGEAGPLYLPEAGEFLDAAHARLIAAQTRATELLTPRRRTLEAMAKALAEDGLLAGDTLAGWLTAAEREDRRLN